MKPKNDIDAFVKGLVKEAGTESPSDSFVSNVMEQIDIEKAKSTLPAYKPVISKAGWFSMAAIFAVISVVVLNSSSQLSLDFFNIDINLDYNFSAWMEKLNIFKGIELSNFLVSSIFIFTGMVLVQLFMIRNYTSRRISF